MTVLCEAEVQAAVYARLAASAPLVAALPLGAGSITAAMGAGLSPPFVLIAETRSRAENTQSYRAQRVDVTLAVYSRMSGGTEARNLLALLAEALATPLSVTGQKVIVQVLDDSRVSTEQEGQVLRGEITLRLYCAPVTGE